MAYKTRTEINLALAPNAIATIKAWRQAQYDAGSSRNTARDFYVAHGACPICAGSLIVQDGFDRETGAYVQIACACAKPN